MPRMPRTMQTGIDIVDRVRLAKCLSSKDKIFAKKRVISTIRTKI
jgi:phosphopantetheinyl transferase (holo-ACP synthase)